MAITKIHPIKKTLSYAINYITDDKKTDEKILVSSFNCNPISAHKQFEARREQFDTRGTVLARHLIQSFFPGETDAETAHRIGQELCEKILRNEYEYVLATHVDKDHIHNHIIFNNVNFITGKCYQSNKKSYHKIRFQSDELCKENKLSVIDKYYESYKRKYKTRGKSWYENEMANKGKSWKSKLQFDIDRMIKQSRDWEVFLKKMTNLGYEIKHGKHIAFRYKDKKRFTRAKTIGEDYVEDRLKERIEEKRNLSIHQVKKRVGNIVDLKNNKKVQANKGYEYWARKHNLKTMADSVLALRNLGVNSKQELDKLVEKTADERQDLLDKIKEIEQEMENLSATMEEVEMVRKYRGHYKYAKENPDDKSFEKEYSAELKIYITAATSLSKKYKTIPKSKEILKKLDLLQEEKNTLMKEYSHNKEQFSELVLYQKNYESYMDKEVER
ncbi:relaxase/mobilization nuclease domain-containing protein [Ureaplasma miroungigenitalium]|uniref:Relaxase/mobilization nuclease domain-containing protein n=1 Tax=Ureaplasma miroungigenitalium TaxID=1042321 RepID=A0ABT3BM46_9BACT|nr:relaxase/mobilization nuclease domain-containing protein [Ureaplasma miroungigenitalium]MCV3728318.1 relaxase/mobilization nuclease domain-containing protein [Ureaplasma miroungigenitalium]